MNKKNKDEDYDPNEDNSVSEEEENGFMNIERNTIKKQNKRKKRKNSDSSYSIKSDDLSEADSESDEEVESFSISEVSKESKKKRKPKENKEKVAKIKAEKPVKEKKEKAKKEPKEPKEPKSKVVKEPKAVKPKKNNEILDSSFKLENAYYYQSLTLDDKSNICAIIKNYFSNLTDGQTTLNLLIAQIPNIKKGKNNTQYLFDSIEILSKEFLPKSKFDEFFSKYNSLIKLCQGEYLEPKPTIRECHFFPNPENEFKVANILRTCKSTLDIAIFALTNDRIGASIEEAFKRGVKVRIIADDECAKFQGAEVFRLAALGIPTKTDNSVRFHMHHKFAVLDNSVVITGSFNWTSQAVKYNQENILFLECPLIAQRYTEEYNHLWDTFIIEIKPKEALKLIEEQNEKHQKMLEERKKRKEQEKANNN